MRFRYLLAFVVILGINNLAVTAYHRSKAREVRATTVKHMEQYDSLIDRAFKAGLIAGYTAGRHGEPYKTVMAWSEDFAGGNSEPMYAWLADHR